MSTPWLREVPATLENQKRADRVFNSYHEWWGRSEYARCPGCRKNKGLRYLEFRNGSEPGDTYRNYSILAVCPATLERLMELKATGAVFGISALVRQVPWICAPVGKVYPAVQPPTMSTCGRCRYCLARGINSQPAHTAA